MEANTYKKVPYKHQVSSNQTATSSSRTKKLGLGRRFFSKLFLLSDAYIQSIELALIKVQISKDLLEAILSTLS